MSIRLSSKEQEDLVLKNRWLVEYLVRKLEVSPSDYEDMISIGTIGLIKAAATFDKSKQIKFVTYASRCINNECFMHFKKEKSHAKDLSLDEPIGNDGEDQITLGDKIPSSSKDFTEQIAENEIFVNFISIILNLLESRERLIMLYEIAGINQSCIAKILNISQTYVSRLERKLNSKVKGYMKTKQKFKEVFSMAIVGNSYQISFSSKDIKQFNKIFATVLQKQTSVTTLPDFKVNCNKERIIIQIPAHPESFSFIAQIIQEIDDFSMTFVSDKNILPVNTDGLQNIESDENDYVMEENESSVIAEDFDTSEVVEEIEVG